MKKDDVLAWIHGFEAAREVERDLARTEPVDSAASVAIGLSLTEFAGRCSDGERGRDRARDDDVRIVRERWAKLRREIAARVPVVSTARDFSSAIRALMEVLDEGPPGMIIGGAAVIALGFPRTTVDIDATVSVPPDDLDVLMGRLGRAGIEPRIGEDIDFAKTKPRWREPKA